MRGVVAGGEETTVRGTKYLYSSSTEPCSTRTDWMRVMAGRGMRLTSEVYVLMVVAATALASGGGSLQTCKDEL